MPIYMLAAFYESSSEPTAAQPQSPAHLWELYLLPNIYNEFLRNSWGKIMTPPLAASAEEAPAGSRAALVAASRGVPERAGSLRHRWWFFFPQGRRGSRSSFGYSDSADVCPRDLLRWRSFLIDFIRAPFSLLTFPLKGSRSRTPYPKCMYVYLRTVCIRIRIFIFIVNTVHPFMQRMLLMPSGSGQETPLSEPRCARSRCVDTNPAAPFC